MHPTAPTITSDRLDVSYFLAYLVSLGYPADGPLRPLKQLNRRPFDEVVHRDRW